MSAVIKENATTPLLPEPTGNEAIGRELLEAAFLKAVQKAMDIRLEAVARTAGGVREPLNGIEKVIRRQVLRWRDGGPSSTPTPSVRFGRLIYREPPKDFLAVLVCKEVRLSRAAGDTPGTITHRLAGLRLDAFIWTLFEPAERVAPDECLCIALWLRNDALAGIYAADASSRRKHRVQEQRRSRRSRTTPDLP